MDQTTIIVLMMAMFVCVVLIAGGGYYISTLEEDDGKEKKTGSCEGVDLNGVYEYNDEDECVFKGCVSGYYPHSDETCAVRRSNLNEFTGGANPLDCVVSGYTYGACTPKNPNVQCGSGAGTQLRTPVINPGDEARAGGTCENPVNVDCDIECPDVCNIDPSAYVYSENAVCLADFKGESVELGERYCGTGTKYTDLDPNQIDLGVIQEAGYTNLEEYLNYANPNGACPNVKSTSCSVPCVDDEGNPKLGTDGELLRNVKCNIAAQNYEYIKEARPDGSLQAVCFNKTEAEEYIRGQNSKPKKLDVILAEDVRQEDGTYDLNSLSDDKRYGLYIKYRSDQGISFEDMVKDECTLFTTERCEAPKESVDCELENDSSTASCETFNGCGQPMSKIITTRIKTHPFGGGQSCPSFKTIYESSTNCPIAQRCCEDSDYVASGICKDDGKETYNLNTNYCIKDSLPLTKEVGCCYVGEWEKGECNVDGRPGDRKYTRNLPNPGACTSDELGQNEGDVMYERDTTCDKDCVIGTLVFSDKDENGNQLKHVTPDRQSYVQRVVSYSGTTPAEGLGDNWCENWENNVCQDVQCMTLGNIMNAQIGHSDSLFSGLNPATNAEVNKYRKGLRINPSDENYFRCGTKTITRYVSASRGMNCKDGNNPPEWYK